MNAQRGFIVPLLLILISVLLVGSGAYWYTQTKPVNQPAVVEQTVQATSTTQTSISQTAGWKTFRNETYRFELQYPIDWTLKTEGGLVNETTGANEETWYLTLDSPKNIAVANAHPNSEGEPDYWIEISPGKSLNDWFASTFGDRQKDSPELMPGKQDIVFGGLPALSIVDPITEGGCNSEYIVVYFNHDIYTIQDPACSNNDIVKTINLTFKFIDTDAQTWKTYQNEKYGVEFNYPNHWFIDDTSGGAGYANWELTVYPVDPDKYCAELQTGTSKGLLCGVSLGLQIYQDRITKKVIFNKNTGAENGLIVQEQELDQIVSTFKFIK